MVVAELARVGEVDVGTAWRIFGGITALLILFLAALVGLMLVRRRRRRSRAAEEATRDAVPDVRSGWIEAGLRVRAYPTEGEEKAGEPEA
jgi:hypothetical protein